MPYQVVLKTQGKVQVCCLMDPDLSAFQVLLVYQQTWTWEAHGHLCLLPPASCPASQWPEWWYKQANNYFQWWHRLRRGWRMSSTAFKLTNGMKVGRIPAHSCMVGNNSTGKAFLMAAYIFACLSQCLRLERQAEDTLLGGGAYIAPYFSPNSHANLMPV